MKRVVRSAASKAVKVLVPVVAEGKTRVKQEFKKEVNINTIIAKMKRGIVPPWVTMGEQKFADLSRIPSNFMDAFNQVEAARAAFEQMPLEFRRALDHDPRNLPNAPRELFEKYGLLREKPEASGVASGAPDPGLARGVRGDRDLPATRRPGADKGASKAPAPKTDEVEE